MSWTNQPTILIEQECHSAFGENSAEAVIHGTLHIRLKFQDAPRLKGDATKSAVLGELERDNDDHVWNDP